MRTAPLVVLQLGANGYGKPLKSELVDLDLIALPSYVLSFRAQRRTMFAESKNSRTLDSSSAKGSSE